MPLEKLAIGACVVVVALLLVFAFIARKSRSGAQQPVSRSGAPANLHFTCAKCSQRFPHTKRTVAAFERGTKRLFCGACHSTWAANRPQQQRPSSAALHGPRVPGEALQARTNAASLLAGSSSAKFNARPRSSSGCLGAALLIVAVPLSLAVYAAVT